MKKKASVASTSSTDTCVSSTSTTSVASSASDATILTAATTVSASASPLIDALESSLQADFCQVPSVFVTDSDSEHDLAELYYTARSRPVSASEADMAAHEAGLYTLQAGAVLRGSIPRGIFLCDREKITMGACGWSEFRSLSETHGNIVPIRMLDEAAADIEVEVVEVLRNGRTCGIEIILQALAAYTPPYADFDFDGPVGIPGSYPGYPAYSSADAKSYPIIPKRLSLSIPGPLGQGVLSHIPPMSAIDMPYSALSSACSDWTLRSGGGLGALGLEGVPPLANIGSISPASPAPPASASLFEDVYCGRPCGRQPVKSRVVEEVLWETETETEDVRRRVLTFRMPLPTTLAALARGAGERSLQEGVVEETPRGQSSDWWF